MKRLTFEEKKEIRQLLIEENKRIAHARALGNQNEAVNAKCAKHLRPEALAKIYNVTVDQIAYFQKKKGSKLFKIKGLRALFLLKYLY